MLLESPQPRFLTPRFFLCYSTRVANRLMTLFLSHNNFATRKYQNRTETYIPSLKMKPGMVISSAESCKEIALKIQFHSVPPHSKFLFIANRNTGRVPCVWGTPFDRVKKVKYKYRENCSIRRQIAPFDGHLSPFLKAILWL